MSAATSGRALVAALVGMAGLAWWSWPPSVDARAAAAQAAVIAPYAADVAAGRLAEARALWTSAKFQAEVSEIVFLAAQSRNRDELGAPITLTWDGSPPEVMAGPEGTVLRLPATAQGPNGALSVLIDVVETAEGWRIDGTWTRPKGGVGVERVF